MEAVAIRDERARAGGARVFHVSPELEQEIKRNLLRMHYAEAVAIAADFERRYVTRPSGDLHRGG